MHGDIKPENIVIAKRRTWKMMLVDFGSSWGAERSMHRDRGDGVTPVYAAPECQSKDSKSANYLSDQFSASVVLFEMLTGEIPYARLGGAVGNKPIGLENPSEMLLDKTRYPQQVLANVDELIHRGLSLEPSQRFTGSREWCSAAYRAVDSLNRNNNAQPSGMSLKDRWKILWQ